jgi:phenylalanyl-tRNA synthetase beta chain
LSGPVRPGSWRDQTPPDADFFAVKGVLAGLLGAAGVPWELRPFAAQTLPAPPFLHPGRSAEVIIGDERAGWIGELHPSIAGQWDLEDAVAAFEIDLDVVAGHVAPAGYRDVTSYPEVREDLAVVVAETVPAATVVATALQAGRPLLVGAEVFDVYRDAERVGDGHVSLALRLRYRASDRTLTDEEVAGRRKRIVKALSAQLEGRVRDS